MRGGIWSDWLKANLPPGSWILDPLGSHPALAIEAARAGYRVLTTINNPILSFLLDVLARNPGREDFQAALVELADAADMDGDLYILVRSEGTAYKSDGTVWSRKSNAPGTGAVACSVMIWIVWSIVPLL